MEAVVEAINKLYDILTLSGGLQKFNNLQHYQIEFNSNDNNSNMIILDAKSVHSVSISVDTLNKSSMQGCYNLTIEGIKICYDTSSTFTATTLFDKEIKIEVMPNTKLTIIKQY